MTNLRDQLRDARKILLQVPFVKSVTVDESEDGRAVVRLTDRNQGVHRLTAVGLEVGAAAARPATTKAREAAHRDRLTALAALPARARPQRALSMVSGNAQGNAGRVLGHRGKALATTILVARFFDRHAGELLRLSRVNHVDAAGNLYLELDGGRFLAHVEGRLPRRQERQRSVGLRAAGQRVLFAILASPDLLGTTVRELGRQSGASRQAVSELLARLRTEGALVRDGRSQHHFVPGRREALRERFATGWLDSLRPTLLVATYRLRETDTARSDATIERLLNTAGVAWGFGGTAGAMRLAPHYRGRDTVLHVEAWTDDFTRRLGLVPDRNGPVQIYRSMGKLDLLPKNKHCAHPLLVYAELVASPDDRAREAAGVLADALLRDDDR